MKSRTAIGAVFSALVFAAGVVSAAEPAALAAPDPGSDRALLFPAELQRVDIIGACDRLGAGVLYVRLLCSNGKKSECSTRFNPVNAAGAVATREEVRLNIKATTLPYSVSADNVNSAAFRSCVDGSPVLMDKIEIWNNFTVSGVQLDYCTVGLTGGTADNTGTALGSVSCTIKTREDTFGDDRPASCTQCAQLNSDVYQWYARWSLGVITRYLHEARALFTRNNAGNLRVSTVVDFGI